jgi:hypothetical protein
MCSGLVALTVATRSRGRRGRVPDQSLQRRKAGQARAPFPAVEDEHAAAPRGAAGGHGAEASLEVVVALEPVEMSLDVRQAQVRDGDDVVPALHQRLLVQRRQGGQRRVGERPAGEALPVVRRTGPREGDDVAQPRGLRDLEPVA